MPPPPDNTSSLLDQLEEWLEAQVPPNLHDLPYRMLETMERVSNELFETLNIHGPPSISIPFPPFAKETPPPPPPPPAPSMSVLDCRYWGQQSNRLTRLIKAHPYAVMGGAALALTVGLGVGRVLVKGTYRIRRSVNGKVEDGMLKDAVVLLVPSPMPPMLWPLVVSLLRAGYVVVVAVPNVEDAEQLEKRLSGLAEKNSLRVLIYDTEDPTTFPAFHRSLLATLTLRFPALGQHPSDPYNPRPDHVPSILAYISLYALNPCPPTQPGALPAIPTLLSPNPNGKVPKLITLYPSTSVLTQPDSFASQVLTANHRLLGSNVEAFSSARVISVYVGDVYLPRLHSLILSAGPELSRRQQAKLQLQQASATQKVSIVKDYIYGSIKSLFYRISAYTGFGTAGQNYTLFESSLLRVIRSNCGGYKRRREYHLGQYSYLSLFLSRLPPTFLPYLVRVLPSLPGANGPTRETVQGLPAPRKPLISKSGPSATNAGNTNPRGPRPLPSGSLTSQYLKPGSAGPTGGAGVKLGSSGPPSQTSSASSDHEENDMVSSFHTTGTTGTHSSRGHAESERSDGSGRDGLGDSWVGLDSGSVGSAEL